MNASWPMMTAFILVFAGCGNFQKEKGESQGTVAGEPPKSLAIQTSAELPTCDTNINGQLVYVVTESSFYTCDATRWVAIEVKGVPGADGAKGDPGAQGEPGEKGSTTDRFQSSLALYKDYKQSITRLKLECACTDVEDKIFYGSGFFCAEDKICTNVHVIACPTTGGCSLSRLSAQTTDATSDSIRPNGNEITAFYNNAAPELTLHVAKDLAKISIPNLPVGAKVLPIAETTLAQTGEITLTGILSLSFPLGMDDLYTDLGYVNSNVLDDCNTTYCPGPYYDFATSNDTDHGSSGSPLLDINSGKVVGVTTAGTEGENANYTWAIDASFFNDF